MILVCNWFPTNFNPSHVSFIEVPTFVYLFPKQTHYLGFKHEPILMMEVVQFYNGKNWLKYACKDFKNRLDILLCIDYT